MLGDTFLNFEYEMKNWVFEECLNHSVIDIAKNGFDDAAHHAHAHFVIPLFEGFEDVDESSWKLWIIEEVVLDHIFGVFGLLEDVG